MNLILPALVSKLLFQNMINEKRRQEIQERLRRERDARRQLIAQGQEVQLVQDESLLQTPSIGHDSFLTVDSQASHPSQPSRQPSQHSSVLEAQKLKLQEMKKNFLKKKDPHPPISDHLNRLAEPKTALIEQREKQKQQLEDQQFAELPFLPQISDQSQMLATLKYSKFEGMPIYERLYLLEQERKEHIEELKLGLNQEQEFPESKIPKPYVSSSEPPLFTRYQLVVQEQKAHLDYLKAQQLKEEEGLFRPKINYQSQLIAEIKSDGRDVVARLMDDAKQKQERLYEPHESECEFKPRTNKEFNEVVVKGSFEERQNYFSDRQIKKIDQIASEVYNNYTFKPVVSKNSQQLGKLSQSQEPVHERLYNLNQERLQQQQEKQQEQQQLSNPYPELNPKSMQMAAERKFEDLVKNEYGEYRKYLLKQKYEEPDKECSFYPSVSTTRYSQMHSQYSYDDCSEKIKKYQQEKENKRQQAKKSQEQEALSQCTFKPEINKRALLNSTKYAEVNGMEAFLSKVDIARKQKESQQYIESKLFETHKRYDFSKHQNPTKPQVFNLTVKQECNSYAK